MADSVAHHAERRLIVIDDNRNFQHLMRTILRHLGFRSVEVFGDPVAAKAYVAQNHVDLVFVDISMPAFDGVRWIGAIRVDPAVRNRMMPIVVVSGHTSRAVVQAAVNAGADDVLSKPISPRTLHDRALRLLDRPQRYVERANGYVGPDLMLGPRRPERSGRGARNDYGVDRRADVVRRTMPALPGFNVPLKTPEADMTFLD